MCPLCDRSVPLSDYTNESEVFLDVCRECHQLIDGIYPSKIISHRPDLWTVKGLQSDPMIASGLRFVKLLQHKPGNRKKHIYD